MVSTALLDTAIDQFGRCGFEGASTRDIARASGTAMSSITYHFGGKQGLYLAAADHIATGIAAEQATALSAAQAGAGDSRAATIAAALALIESFARMMLDARSEHWARFIIREQQQPTAAFERLWTGAMAPLAETFIVLVRRIRDDLDEPAARALAVMLFGEAIVLRAARASVCRMLGVEAIDDAAAALLLDRLRANACCILNERSA